MSVIAAIASFAGGAKYVHVEEPVVVSPDGTAAGLLAEVDSTLGSASRVAQAHARAAGGSAASDAPSTGSGATDAGTGQQAGDTLSEVERR
jgi:hypothetical protein